MRFRPLREVALTKFFRPKTWAFWRSVIVAFCICCILGHWLEAFYCMCMDALFGIVEDDYAIFTDPWIHPYWVYGFGALGMTLVIEPLREHIRKRRKTTWGAVLETFVIAVFLAMAMELGFGLIVNQPDANGVYPFWDNSQLPLNIFGQAWLVNDIFMGLVSVLYVWVLFPFICEAFSMMKPRTANVVFAIIVFLFCLCCFLSYMQLILWIWKN